MLIIGLNLYKNLSKIIIILIIIIDMLILIKKLDLILIVIIVKNDIKKMIYIFDEYKCVHSYYSYYLLFIF